MGTPDDPRVDKAVRGALDWTPRYNGAPGQEHWVIRQNPKLAREVTKPPVVGAHSMLVERHRPEADQCQSGDRRLAAHVSRRV